MPLKLCKCGCGQEIIIKYNHRIPQYICGHHSKKNPNLILHLRNLAKEKKGKTYEEWIGKEKAEIYKEKIRQSNSRRGCPQKTRDRISIANTGKKRTESFKKLISQYGKTHHNSGMFKKNHKPTQQSLINWAKSIGMKPTGYEKELIYLLNKYRMPFKYVGNFKFIIGGKNPDFIDEFNKICIEVYYSYFKIRDFGSCEEYEKQRSKHFAKYGWKTVFINEKELKNDINILHKIKSFNNN